MQVDMKPRVFIGSSVEGKRIADAIQQNLSYTAYPTIWNQMVFPLSGNALESLIRAAAENDFAVLVLSPDDAARIRDEAAIIPRTNVVFEAGLFFGKLGRDRAFVVQPRSYPGFTLPTDLLGVTPATYDEAHYQRNPQAALGPACTEISNAFTTSSSFTRAVTINADFTLEDPATSSLTYPKKFNLRVTNRTSAMVAVRSLGFEAGAAVTGDARLRVGATNEFKLEFLVGKDAAGNDAYRAEVLLRPGESVRAWLGLDRNTDNALAQDALNRDRGEIGTWHLGCHWLADPLEYREHQFRF